MRWEENICSGLKVFRWLTGHFAASFSVAGQYLSEVYSSEIINLKEMSDHPPLSGRYLHLLSSVYRCVTKAMTDAHTIFQRAVISTIVKNKTICTGWAGWHRMERLNND